jgi:acyl transferase domain-containing protein/surfactin synthase thioesterase subunit/acyl carrier protein
MSSIEKAEESLQRAAAVIDSLGERLPLVAAQPEEEAIAIVGMGCRYPGGIVDAETFWRVLEEGIDAVTEVPRERWDIDALYDPDPAATGKMTTRCGGFLPEIDRFDAEFFGISPREAVSLDPQQRLLLETSWEALEHAGIAAERLEGSGTGVFVGLMSHEYGTYGTLGAGLERLDGYVGTGSLASVASGRISYVLGLQGPSLTVDTATSSSLVAAHLACQSLRRGECSLALAGGVTLLLTPNLFIEFSRLRGLAADGRCKTFSAKADGTGWSEGCGMVVLERLSDARRNGHRVLAVIRGSAVNQDGRSNGLTAPNGPSQEAVIRRALAQAGVKPSEVGYVECHGTGTRLGDPIEVQALGAVLAEGRPADRPVVIGSLKSNLGHTQAAAGVSGLIKVVLSLQHGRIPKNLHFDAPSPHIPWADLPVKVALEAMAWARNGAARIAGVSSFGVSGTNAYVVVEEAPAEVEAAPQAASPRAAELVVLSAKSAEALDAAASRLADHVKAHPEQALGDIAYSLATTRSHHEHRLALAVATRAELVSGLEAASRGELPGGASREEARSQGRRAWLFTGQGSQHVGMGRGLWEEWPAFREAFDAACVALDPHLEAPLREVMWAAAQTARLDETGWTQPALFALQVGLSALWRSWGIEPDVVAGHSIGELSAAYVAGVFSLEDAARLVATRGRLMQALPRGGAMVSIAASEAEIGQAVAALAGRVSIAAVNGPLSVVISGEEAGVLAVSEAFAAKGLRTKRLTVSHAFHSALMDPMLEEFHWVAEQVAYRPARIVVVSDVSGQAAGSELSTAEYWVRHVRESVRFADGVGALHAAGVTQYLEIGPKSTLLGLVPACLPLGAQEPVLVASLRAERAEAVTILEALGAHHVRGGQVQWDDVFPNGGTRVGLPSYPWQRERYWIESAGLQTRAGEATGHPLLGVRVSMAGADAVYESVLSRAEHPWLYDHCVGDQVLMPGAGLGELARAAGEHCFGGAAVEMSSLVLQAPLALPEQGGQRVQVLVSEKDDRTEVSIYSQRAEASAGAEWTLHATGEVRLKSAEAAPRIDLAAVRMRCLERVEVEQAYEGLSSTGLPYGPSFQGLQALWNGTNEAVAEVSLPEGVDGAERYGIHPVLLDAAFQSLLGIARRPTLHLPFALDKLTVHRSGAMEAVAYVRMRPESESADGFTADVMLTDAQGEVLVEAVGLRGRPLEAEALHHGIASALYRVDWLASPKPSLGVAPSGRCVVVAAGQDEGANALIERLRALGAACERVDMVGLPAVLPAQHVVCLWHRAEDEADVAAATRMSSEGLSVVQLLAKQEQTARLWWVTRGAVAVTATEPADVGQASLWGLGRTVMQEHPELDCTLIDIADGPDAVEQLACELTGADDEREIAWRGGERRVTRLSRAAQGEALRHALCVDGTVLITGGLGALGLHVARWLAQRGMKHLVLTGRRGRQTPGIGEAVAEIEALGARVTVAAMDVSDGDAVRALLETIPSDVPLRGVVHTAGVLDDGVLLEQSAERFERVLAPKVGGACHLDALTRSADLDFFVLFSSVTGTLGSAGQGGYTAANACLDALAARRRAEGLTGQSLAWGLWTDASSRAAGLASGLDGAQQARFEKSGLAAVDPLQGVALLEAALGRREAQLVPVPLDLSVLRKTFGEAVPPLWRGLVRAPRRAAAGGVAWVRELGSLPTERRHEAALEAVRAEVARVLSLEGPGAVATDRPLKELGLDSLMALELRNALGKRAGKTLPATLAFDYPTPAAIAGYLIATVLPRPENIDDHVPIYNPRKLVVAKLSEAAIELKNLFHKGAAAPELDEATRISIEQFASVFIEQFSKLNNHNEISPACLRTVSSPKVRLFCFPCAGGRAESFQKWNPYLPEGIELHAFPYPRSGPAVGDIDLYTKTVIASIMRYSEMPYAIAGHSLGSIIAWHVTKVLAEKGGRLPELLIASGCAAPSVFKTLFDRFSSPEELIATISGTNISPREIPTDVVEMFAQDVQLVTKSPAIEQSISVPILAVVGEADAVIRPDHLEGWREATSANVDIEIVAGTHHYWFEEASCEQLVASIVRRLTVAGPQSSLGSGSATPLWVQ